MGSARESVKPRDSSGSAALAFILPAVAVARRVISQRSRQTAKSGPLRSQTCWQYGSGLIRHISKGRLKCARRQILVHSHFSSTCPPPRAWSSFRLEVVVSEVRVGSTPAQEQVGRDHETSSDILIPRYSSTSNAYPRGYWYASR